MKKKLGMMICVLAASAVLASGCGSSETATAYVQQVSMIAGTGSVGITERFAGISCARSETKVKVDSSKTIADVLVAAGDEVTEGQTLVTYDMDAAALSLEKAQLELDQLNDALASKQKEKTELETQKAKAKADDQLNYTLEIEACDTSIREQNYNIALKEKEVATLQASLEVTEVTSPVTGRVKSLTGSDSSSDSTSTSTSSVTEIVIVESGTLRVKGYVNENNSSSISEGMDVIVRSRLDSSVIWKGAISSIDWDNPQTSSSVSYSDSEMSTTSSFPFYVELDSSDDLLLGQHVYIEPDYGQEDVAEGLQIPEYYLVNIDGDTAEVWVENENGKLEKRTVTLGAHDEDLMTYVITDGLTEDDYIAFPDDSLTEGMNCSEYDDSVFEADTEADDSDYDADTEIEEDATEGTEE